MFWLGSIIASFNGFSMIYLDYASTTPVDPRVVQKMSDFLTKQGHFGNPSSQHFFGKAPSAAVAEAREQVANLVGAKPECILWTSGATESNNLAIKGVAEFYQRRGRHIITSQTEHRSVLDVCTYLMQRGFEVTFLKPNIDGIIEPDAVAAAFRDDTILVSLMHVNNEVGTIQDIEKIAKLTRDKGILFHVDAVQSTAKLPINLENCPVDLMSFSAHKLYGPKGIGALYVCDNPKARLIPLLHGSGQENNLRSGTLPTHQIVGMGEAYRIACEEMPAELARIQGLQSQFWAGLKNLPGVYLNGHPTKRVPTVINLRFENKEKEALMAGLETLAFSTSSSCTAGRLETSHVLRAMGLHNELAHRSLRFSFGRDTTEQEIQKAIKLILEAYNNDK